MVFPSAIYMVFLPAVLGVMAVIAGVRGATRPIDRPRYWRRLILACVLPATILILGLVYGPELFRRQALRSEGRLEALAELLIERVGADMATMIVAAATAILVAVLALAGYVILRTAFRLAAERCLDAGLSKEMGLLGLIPLTPLLIGLFPTWRPRAPRTLADAVTAAIDEETARPPWAAALRRRLLQSMARCAAERTQ